MLICSAWAQISKIQLHNEACVLPQAHAGQQAEPHLLCLQLRLQAPRSLSRLRQLLLHAHGAGPLLLCSGCEPRSLPCCLGSEPGALVCGVLLHPRALGGLLAQRHLRRRASQCPQYHSISHSEMHLV